MLPNPSEYDVRKRKLDYSRWANFSRGELQCSHTGLENPNTIEFTRVMDFAQALRDHLGVPLGVSSGYRSPTHPTEAKKKKPGQHSKAAIDLKVPMKYCHQAIKFAMLNGVTGLGVNLTGDPGTRFIHFDFRTRPAAWSY